MATRSARRSAPALGAGVPSLVLAFLALVTLACGDASGPEGPEVVRTDSAGIRIVETRRAAWAEGGSWTLASEPDLVIGRLEGEAPYLFGEITGAVRLDDGSIVVADDQASELRWFDPSGTFVRAVGGPGEGPSEFPRGVYSLGRCGPERIYARDLYARRVLSWSPAGGFQRSFALVEPVNPTRGPYHATCTDDGGFVAIGWGGGDRISMPELPAGAEAVMYTQEAPVWALDSLAALETELGTFLSSERIRTRGGSGPHPFGRAVRIAAGGGRVYLGTGEGLEVSVYMDGELERIHRALTEDLALDPAVLDAYRAADLDEADARDRGLVESADFAMPPAIPAFTGLRVSPDGHLWAKRFVMPGTSAHRWGVFDPDGVFLGNLELPGNLAVTEIGDDYVLGVVTDELDVQRVQLHRLVRQASVR